MQIHPGAMTDLAIDIARKVLNMSVSHATVTERMQGTYHLMNVVQFDNGSRFIIRIPAVGWGHGLSHAAGEALKSEIATMRLIREKTTTPLPDIYAWDHTCNNIMRAPYICMSYVPGRPVCKVWYGSKDNYQLRLTILDNVAKIMASYANLPTFPKIGSLQEDASGELVVGPVCDWTENHDMSLQIKATGPFISSKTYLDYQHRYRHTQTVHLKAAEKLLPVIKSFSPLMDSNSNFVICPPNFDSHSVFVDEAGNVTAFLDWSHAKTMPRHAGWARYPDWLTCDWDPRMGDWPQKPHETESSQQMAKYRVHYNDVLGKAMQFGGDWHVNGKSHLAMAVWNASTYPTSRQEIVCKFIEAAYGQGTNGISVLWEIGEGWFDNGDMVSLSKKLKRVIA